MAGTRVNPTRMELTKQKKKLLSATRGHKLLKDKRDELVRQFMDLIKENMDLRLKVEKGLKAANMEFAVARAGMSEQVLNTALMATGKTLEIKQQFKNVMSVEIPEFQTKNDIKGNDIYSYGYAFTAGDLDDAVYSLSSVFEDMLKLAQVEKSCQLMASEIEKTRRRVNALEHVIIPEALDNIKYITMKLDENERSTQIRLMKVKDMMIEENIQEKKIMDNVAFATYKK
ncbi:MULTISPECIES: V-type ATP synthase subunit D [unclassified Eubacterium (in: firmicutes)]|uniref:V-type ATP synthase subunit D n=1 Tax=Eubacterium TaxID=1730 RepID=UPI000E4D2AE3|nr:MULTISPECIES: V-type ATP synthase subunit D [unclassified Eubacterium (in: firmicutes)]RGF52980.1 V-type ATP synthase subunit D [Eubacterium sp. AF36-5BH]RHP22822.1 V-type ATP synthase subunit D [Eubacterium sp. AF34-35BH]